MFWITPAAPGFRAMPSEAAAEALACANPQAAEAMAIAKPEVIATQFVGAAMEPPSVWANAEGASSMNARTTSRNVAQVFPCFLIKVNLLHSELAGRRWLPTSSCSRDRAARRMMPVRLMNGLY